MASFLLRKAGAALTVVLLVSVLVFAGIRAVPGDPATVISGGSTEPAVLKAIRHEYLLDKPLPVQYGRWLWLALHGNLGTDESGLSVANTIVGRLPPTLELATLSLLVSLLVGIPAGVVAAARRGSASDYVVTGAGLIGLCVPQFWLALLLIVWFAVDLHWLPATGYVTMNHPIANLRHMLLPCLVLGLGFAAVLMRHTRSSMLTALGSDYVRTARAKGLPEWQVVGRHALRNSLITVTTIVGLEFGALISGAAVMESIFGIPGFGLLGLQATTARDYPMIEGVVLVAAAAYVLANLIVDFLYSAIDPRIRVGSRT